VACPAHDPIGPRAARPRGRPGARADATWQTDRLVLGARCPIAAADASLIETPVCGAYLRVDRATRLDTDEGGAVAVEPGIYQVIRTQE
jgi:hypothetical protein